MAALRAHVTYTTRLSAQDISQALARSLKVKAGGATEEIDPGRFIAQKMRYSMAKLAPVIQSVKTANSAFQIRKFAKLWAHCEPQLVGVKTSNQPNVLN
jgi:hypothetical protein